MDVYKQQWEEEKRIFFDALEKEKFVLFRDCICVDYPGTENTNDPRMICYHFGDRYLMDDHCSAQQSDNLTPKQLSDIFYVLKKNDVNVERYDLFYECYGSF